MVVFIIFKLVNIFGVLVENIGLIVFVYLIFYGMIIFIWGLLLDCFGRKVIIFFFFICFILFIVLIVIVFFVILMLYICILIGMGVSGVVFIFFVLIGDLFLYIEWGRVFGWIFGVMVGGMVFGFIVGVIFELFIIWCGFFFSVIILVFIVLIILLLYRNFLNIKV